MESFDQMAAAQHPLGIAMQIPDMTLDLRQALEDHDGDHLQAADDPGLRRRWEEVEPETRAALLLNFAWHSREHDVPLLLGNYAAVQYASDLHDYAANFTGDAEAFHGPQFPMMPLPGQAGALASSVGFDRDDTDVALITVMILMEPVYKAAVLAARDDQDDNDEGPHLEPCPLGELPEDFRRELPAGATAMRCTGCGDIRVERPGVDGWKNHWPDECEALQAAGGR